MDTIENTGVMSTMASTMPSIQEEKNNFSYQQTKAKSIKVLIKYFEIKYKITEIIKINSKISKELIQSKSISSSKMLILFFEIVLNYYHKNAYVPIDYSSTESEKVKIKMIENIYDIGYSDLFKKLFDLADFMFKTIYKILIKIEEGYEKWDRTVNISLSPTIFPNLDILFYITFYPVFPQDLRDVLHKELRLNDIEYKIIKKCNDQIIRYNSKICNTSDNVISPVEINDFSKFDFISDEQKTFLQSLNLKLSPTKSKLPKNIQEYHLNTQDGVMTLFSIISKLRNFDNRRKSRQDSI
jgi:hypothetical protein